MQSATLRIGVLACVGYCVLAAVSGLGAVTQELPECWKGRWVVYKDLGAPGISIMTDAEAKATLHAWRGRLKALFVLTLRLTADRDSASGLKVRGKSNGASCVAAP